MPIKDKRLLTRVRCQRHSSNSSTPVTHGVASQLSAPSALPLPVLHHQIPPRQPHMTASNKQSSTTPQQVPELGGPGQSFPAAGVLAAAAASFSPDSNWLHSYLTRTLSSDSGLRLQSGARQALFEQSLEILNHPIPSDEAANVANGYLCASAFESSQALPLVTAVLHADVIAETLYDSRAREALLRFVTALHLPPRVLYQAEAALATLVQALAENARSSTAENVEAVEEDDQHSRRRRNMKWLKVGAAGVVGGIALGLSGGLIAPALLPALTTVGLGSVSAPLVALGGGGAYAIGGLFGAAGAGVGAAAMASRTGAVDDFRFEPCRGVCAFKHSVYETARVTHNKRVHDVVVPCNLDGAAGGLLVWEILTAQEFVMVVPGLITFAVGVRERTIPIESPAKSLKAGKSQKQLRAPKAGKPPKVGKPLKANRANKPAKITWLLPEEQMEVGGVDRDRIGESKRRRATGAITVPDGGEYVLRFCLMHGSLPVNLSYRCDLVPPGRDPPLWVMEEDEEQSQEQVIGDIRSLSMAIFIPGLLSGSANGAYPGMCADQFASTAAELDKYDIQCFALRWDTDLLIEMSDALRKLIGRMALSMAAQNSAMMIAPALVGAVALPVSLIGALRTLIGNTWARAISHAEECGYMLAAELASRSFGNRPVSLAGYSVGATVVFSCLRELARRNLVGIVHDACLIGAPCTANVVAWREMRSVVSGRLVNVYNPHDWYLELYHSGTNLMAVAGTRSIEDATGKASVENICLERDQVKNHTDYMAQCSKILVDIGFGDADKLRPWPKMSEYELLSDEEDVEIADPGEVTVLKDEGGGGAAGFAEKTDESDEVTLFRGMSRRRRQLRT